MAACHECGGTGLAGAADGANAAYLDGVPCRACGGRGENTRRKEGARPVLYERVIGGRVKVTAHAGDRFMPAMVCIWKTGDLGAWSMLAAELSTLDAFQVAEALDEARGELAKARAEEVG